MKTLFVTRKYPPQHGGMETFSWELTNRFPTQKKVIKISQRTQRQILWILPLLCVRTLFNIHSSSVIHLGDLVLAPIARVTRLFTKKPIVVTVHALELTYKRQLLKTAIDSSLSAIDHFVAVSDYTRGLLMDRGVPADKITVIPHGVDIPEFDRTESRTVAEDVADASANTLILLSVGRLQRRKGVAWFLESVIPLLHGLDFRYVVTSTGPEYKRLQHFITQHGLEEQVKLVGKVDSETLHHLYAGADIFVMPNIPVENDAEGFGFVAIEAAAYGLPVLASRLEGITSAIADGENGLLITPKHAEGYADNILEWARDEKQRKAFGKRTRRYTKNHSGWSEPVDAYQKLFTMLQTPESKRK